MRRLTVGVRALMLLLASCGGDEAAQDANKTEARKAPPPVSVETTAKTPETAYVYSPTGKRDPFQSYLQELAAQRRAEEAGRSLEATEQFDVGQYRLTAVISGTTQPRALVEDPSGMGHVLQVGSKLGRNGGRVTRIMPRGVLLVEQHRDAAGKLSQVPIKIELPEDPPLILMGKR